MNFFIVGTSRTGSTLLRHMLARHGAVAILNESHWIPTMWMRYRDRAAPTQELLSIVERTHWDSGRRVIDVNLDLMGGSWPQLGDGLRERLGKSTTVAAFQDALVDELHGEDPGSKLLGDKTPDYGFYMPVLQTIWPTAHFVHITRNGIDTAHSMSNHPGCRLMISAGYDNWVPLSYDYAFSRCRTLPLPLSSFISSWRRRMTRIRAESAALVPGTYLEVRYEDLLTHPRSVLEVITHFLHLRLPQGWLDACVEMVRPRFGIPCLSDSVARDLAAEDLLMLNEVGGLTGLHFGPATPADKLEGTLERLERSEVDDGTGARLARSILATRAALSDASLRRRASALLGRSRLRADGPPDSPLATIGSPHYP